MNKQAASIKKIIANTDWNLLVFLLLFCQVKLIGKLLGLAFLFIRQYRFRFQFSSKWPGIPAFYLCMIILGLINCVLYGLYHQANYLVLLATGISFWLLCIVAFGQVSVAVQRSSVMQVQHAIIAFFIINALASFGNIVAIIAETGAINPYRYQGNYQKYFIGTGDYIKGITFDTSTTNAILNSFGAIYFLSKKRFVMSLLCMAVLLLTTSNFINLLLVISLVAMFVLQTNRDQKSIIVVQLAMLVLFMTSISPQNNKYSGEVLARLVTGKPAVLVKQAREIPVEERPDSVLNPEQKKYKAARLYLDSMRKVLSPTVAHTEEKRPEIPKANIHAPEYQHRQDSSEIRKTAIIYLERIEKATPINLDTSRKAVVKAGKLVGFRQLFSFMKAHPAKLLTGNGIGNFSSKLAFRAAGVTVAGVYPARFAYISPAFEENHLATYLVYASKDSGFHSITNLPNSSYAQLLGEYGMIGMACFLFFYLGYFWRARNRAAYMLPIMFIMFSAFAMDYWFEHFSVVVFFELLMLTGMKE